METLNAICKDYISQIESLKNRNIEMYSYSVWAIEEILKASVRYPDMSELGLICLMSSKFDSYSCMDPRSSYMFSVAKDVSDYILDELLDERRLNV